MNLRQKSIVGGFDVTLSKNVLSRQVHKTETERERERGGCVEKQEGRVSVRQKDSQTEIKIRKRISNKPYLKLTRRLDNKKER